MRLIDRRFSGIARGVGTAEILGRVHSAQLRLSDLFLPCSFTIMEVRVHLPCLPSSPLNLTSCEQGRDVDLLLGLDMLKGHRACIDLEKNVLRIQGREVSFLSEHELPEKARDLKEFAVEGDESAEHSAPNVSNASSLISRQRDTAPTSFPGGGRTLGSAPSSSSSTANQQGSNQSQPSSSRHLEHKIQILMDLGATREIAISSLDAAGGDVDVAASLLF